MFSFILVVYMTIFCVEIGSSATRCISSDNCCTVTTNKLSTSRCPTCQSLPKTSHRRVRKEIRSLSKSSFEIFSKALRIMKTTNMTVGKSKYGQSFRTYDYFVAKHMSAALDLRGDQGHFSSAFMTFHSLLVLEFENSLLAINPSVGALPYWDWNKTSSSVFVPSLMGAAPGTGPDNEVVAGFFANWTIQTMSPKIWTSHYAPFINSTYLAFNGSTTSGYLRLNAVTNKYLTRYGSSPTSSSSNSSTYQLRSTFPWIEWYSCIEVGGMSSTGDGGDFQNMDTSPNDPIFMLHHANLDRLKMNWMSKNSDAAAYYYGFSTVGNTVAAGSGGGQGGPPDGPPNGPPHRHRTLQGSVSTGVYSGLGLFDTVSSTWGFTDSDTGIAAHTSHSSSQGTRSTLWTHADALCHLQPLTAPYTYDAM